MTNIDLTSAQVYLLLGSIYVRKRTIDSLLPTFISEQLIQAYNEEMAELVKLENKLLAI
jgi:hypothetical protein